MKETPVINIVLTDEMLKEWIEMQMKAFEEHKKERRIILFNVSTEYMKQLLDREKQFYTYTTTDENFIKDE